MSTTIPPDPTARVRSVIGALASHAVVLRLDGGELPDVITAQHVQNRVFAITGVRVSAIQVASTLRSLATHGYLHRSGMGFVRTQAADDSERELAEVDARAKKTIRAHLEAIAGAYAISDPGQLRHMLVLTLEELVRREWRLGDVRVDRERRVVTVPAGALASVDIESLISTVGVPAAFVAPTRTLLEQVVRGEDDVLAWLLADTAAAVVCQAWFRDLSDERKTELLRQGGGLHLILETSYLVDQLMTPARANEAMMCIRDAKRAGAKLEVLQISVEEYLTGLEGAEVELDEALDQLLIYGDGGLGARTALEHASWFCRAAIAHDVHVDFGAAATGDERRSIVNDFIAGLRQLPQRLRDEGVAVGQAAREKSGPQTAQFAGSLLAAKEKQAGVEHDAGLLSHACVIRDSVMLSFIASTDTYLSDAYRAAVPNDDLGRFDVALRPLELSGLIASLQGASPHEGSGREIRGLWRLAQWALDRMLGAENVHHADRPLLVADNGSPEASDRHPRCDEIQDVLDAASKRRVTEVAVLEAAAALPPAATEPGDEFDHPEVSSLDQCVAPPDSPAEVSTPSSDRPRWPAFALGFLVGCLALIVSMSFPAVNGFLTGLVPDAIHTRDAARLGIVSLGALAMGVECYEWKQGFISGSRLLAACATAVLAVLGAIAIVG